MTIEGVMQYYGQGYSRVESTPNFAPFVPVEQSSATSGLEGGKGQKQENGSKDAPAKGSGQSFAQSLQNTINDSVTLSPEAQQQVRELQQRDQEVRSHEQAHVSAGAGHVRGGIQYTYTKGPDNKQYATGGSVSIDTSPIPGDPQATLEKARAVRSAALAPASPSAQDQSVAAAATAMEAEAQTDNQEQERDENGQGHDLADKSVLESSLKDVLDKSDAHENQEKARQSDGLIANAEATAQVHSASTLHFGAQLYLAGNGSFNASSSAFVDTTIALQRSQATKVQGYALSSTEPAEAQTAKVHAAYRTQQMAFVSTTSLAPWGTGIDMRV